MEGAKGQCLCEGKQEPHINPGVGGQPRLRGIVYPGVRALPSLTGAGIIHGKLELCARETFITHS